MLKVYVERQSTPLIQVFTHRGFQSTNNKDEADLFVLMGGADIGSEWYGQKQHPRTTDPNVIWDMATASLIEYAWKNRKPIIGICRGAQFLNAVCGGDMYQHVDGHTGGNHSVLDLETGQVHVTNSIHHQAMIPHKSATIVGVTKEIVSTCRSYMKGDSLVNLVNVGDEPEVEVLYYPHTKSLCFQAHPEYDSNTGSTRRYFYELCERFYPSLFKQEKAA